MSRAATAATMVAAGAAMTVVGVLLAWGPVAGLPLGVTLIAAAAVLAGGTPAAAAHSDRARRPAPERVRRIGRRAVVRGGLIIVAGAGAAVALLRRAVSRPNDGTAWRAGTYVVNSDGQRIRAADVPAGGITTAWPEGAVNGEEGAVVVVRLSDATPQPPTNLEWVVDGTLIAYSKICTHAGCPVGLFRTRDEALFCPCHQATFDAARGAMPVFGPAARPLPQLPLGKDAEDFLLALGGFVEPVGPVRG